MIAFWIVFSIFVGSMATLAVFVVRFARRNAGFRTSSQAAPRHEDAQANHSNSSPQESSSDRDRTH
jgi:cytoskeletal protein RodZ